MKKSPVPRASTVSRLVRAAREAAISRAQDESGETSADAADARGENDLAQEIAMQNERLRTSVKASLLEQISFVARLPSRIRQGLARAAKVRIIHKEDAILLEQGDEVRELVVLCEGEALVSHRADPDDRHGAERPVRVDQAPACFGAYALLSGDEDQPETVRMLGDDAVSLVLDGDDFDLVLSGSENPGLVLELRREARNAGLLGQVPLLAGLNEMQQVQVLHAMHAITFHDGETLSRCGDREEAFFLLVKGKLRRSEGPSAEAPELEPSPKIDDFCRHFGELSLLGDRRAAETVVAEGDATCLYMHRLAFDEQVPHLRRILAEHIEHAKPAETETFAGGAGEESAHSSNHEESAASEQHCFDLSKPACQLFATTIDMSASEAFGVQMQTSKGDEMRVRRVPFESAYEALAQREFYKDGPERPADFMETATLLSQPQVAPVALRALREEVPAGPSGLLDVVAEAQRQEQRKQAAKKKKMMKKAKKKNKKKKKKKKQGGGDSASASAPTGRIETPIAASGDNRDLLVLTSRLGKRVREILRLAPDMRTMEDLRVLRGLFATNKVVSRLALRMGRASELRLFAHARYAHFEVGQSLWHEGDRLAGLHLVLRGEVHTSMRERLGRKGPVISRTLSTVGAGTALGELCLLDPHRTVYQTALYTARALCDTEVMIIDPEFFHAHGVDPSALQQRINDVRAIDLLSCTRGSAPNFAAIAPFAFEISYAEFPKDFVFSQADAFFEPGWCHFIVSGEVGVYEYCLARRCWNEVSRLGPGEFMSIADASPTLALASISFVSTKKLSRRLLQALDETAAAEMAQVAAHRAEFRKSGDGRSAHAVVAATKTCIPTFVQRQGGPLQRPSIAALAGANGEDNLDAKLAVRQTTRLAPLSKSAGLKQRDTGLHSTDSESGGSGLPRPTTFFAHQSVKQRLHYENARTGENKPVSAAKRKGIFAALRLVEQHYSVNFQERHAAVCQTDAGLKPHHGTVERAASGEQRLGKTLSEKDAFLQRALDARDPDDRIPILRQQKFALVSLHWGA